MLFCKVLIIYCIHWILHTDYKNKIVLCISIKIDNLDKCAKIPPDVMTLELRKIKTNWMNILIDQQGSCLIEFIANKIYKRIKNEFEKIVSEHTCHTHTHA